MSEILQKAFQFLESQSGLSPVPSDVSMAKLCASVENCKYYKYLNGKDAESRALIWQWLEMFAELINNCNSHLVKELNSALKDHSFVVGNSFTIADIALFYAVEPLIRDMTHQEKLIQYINLSRWFDHIQHIEGISRNCNKVVFLKNNIYGA